MKYNLYQAPKVLDHRNVQHYSQHTKEFKHKQVHKAAQFIKLDCIQWDPGSKIFLCHPIEGYNKSTYTITHNRNSPPNEILDFTFIDFTCTCQYFQQNKIPCSHILALYYWFKIRNWSTAGREKYLAALSDGGISSST